jgi:hypothetical protein
MPAVLAAYTWLTGRTAPPPLWALGYHQCRWFRYTQDAVEQIAKQHRDRRIPCDALWLDIEYMDGYRVFACDTQAFPDVAGMLTRLGEQGIRCLRRDRVLHPLQHRSRVGFALEIVGDLAAVRAAYSAENPASLSPCEAGTRHAD